MQFKRILSLTMVFVLSLAAFSGCKKSDGDEYSEFVSYVEVGGGDNANNQKDSKGDNEADNSSTGTSGSGKTNSGSGKTSNGATTTKNGKVDLGGRTIIYHTFWSEPKKGGSDRENTYWKKKTELEKKYNFKFKHVSSNDDNLYDKVITSIVAGKPSCDIMSSKQIAVPAMKQGLFYDLSKLEEINLNDSKWRKCVTEMGTLNGKKYLMEAGKMITSNMILYNKDLFKAKKMDGEDLYTLQKQGKLTLNKLISIMKNMYDGKKASTVVDIFPFNLHIQFAYAYGSQIVSRTPGTTKFQSTIGSNEVTNAFKAAQDLLNSGVVVNNAGSSWKWARDEFLKGNYPILIGSGDLENIASNCSFDLGACVIPDLNGKPVCEISDVQWAAIPYNVKNPHDVAFVWNEMADYIFDVNYKLRYQDIVSSDVMHLLDDISKRQVAGELKVDYYNVINIWSDGVGGVFNEMIAGTTTPASAIQTVNNMIKTKLKTYE